MGMDDATVSPKITQNFMGGTGFDNGGLNSGHHGGFGPWGGFGWGFHKDEPNWQVDRHVSDRVCDANVHLSDKICGVDQHLSDSLCAGFTRVGDILCEGFKDLTAQEVQTQMLVRDQAQITNNGLVALGSALQACCAEQRQAAQRLECLIRETDLQRALTNSTAENVNLRTAAQTTNIVGAILGALGLPVIPSIPVPSAARAAAAAQG